MNIEKFKEAYKHLRDVDKVDVDTMCDHKSHIKSGRQIAKGPAKRNILKHGGSQFICRECQMKHDNPMNHVGNRRQTDEEITVYCPHPEHEGNQSRTMKKACYYGVMEEPYLQTCKRCSQLHKEIPDEQREAIRQAMKGVKKSDEFRQKLRDYYATHPDDRARMVANLVPGAGAGWNEGMTTPQEVRDKQSLAMSGRTYSDDHRKHISEGRKKMLEETGGFTVEHRERISEATARQYAKGFRPNLHHRHGWHDSPKAGRVFYRSSYEKKAYMILDADDSVKKYTAESRKVRYLHPTKKIAATYLVDIVAEYHDGTHVWVEVKPAKWLQDAIIQAKLAAGKLRAEQFGAKFEVWSEVRLFGGVYNEQHIRRFVEQLDSEASTH